MRWWLAALTAHAVASGGHPAKVEGGTARVGSASTKSVGVTRSGDDGRAVLTLAGLELEP